MRKNVEIKRGNMKHQIKTKPQRFLFQVTKSRQVLLFVLSNRMYGI